MTLFRVNPGVRPDLPIVSPSAGVRIRFEDGAYETTDPAEIKVLRRSRMVHDFTALERDLTASPDDREQREADRVVQAAREDLSEQLREHGLTGKTPDPPVDDEADHADQPSDH